MNPLSVMGVGFIGARFCQMYPNLTLAERRESVSPIHADALYLRSTTSNYHPPKGDLKTDIATNLGHFTDVLPNVKGTFNLVSTWFAEHPKGFYSSTALCREHLLESYCQTMNKTYRIFRLCNVIGNDPRASKEKNGLEYMLGRVVRSEEVSLYTGDNYRAFLHVDDVCRAIHLCLDKMPLNGLINIGGPSVRMIDLIEHAKSVTGSKSRITLVAPPRFHQVVQVADYWMDTTELRKLGFIPDMDPYQAVDRVLANL